MVILAAACVSSCGKNSNLPEINPDDENLHYGVLWAVINEPYASFRAEPDLNAAAISYGRTGDVERITKRRIVVAGGAKSVMWYGFEKGWLPETSVITYTNKMRAQKAAGNMRR
jgi:hypothetical protein